MMPTSPDKIDPRILRTQKLIIQAFHKLTLAKDFKDITVKDITDEATINRATFYAHFADKYELMEESILRMISERIGGELKRFEHLGKETVADVFLLIVKFQSDYESRLTSQCKRSSQSFAYVFESAIKSELEKLFRRLFQSKDPGLSPSSVRIGAALLSSSLYGAMLDWKNEDLSAEQYIRYAIPYLSGEYFS